MELAIDRVEVQQVPAKEYCLRLALDYLDPKDGITLEILHDSEKRYPNISGSIRGVPNGFEDLGRVIDRTPSTTLPFPFNSRKAPQTLFFIAIALGLLVFSLGLLPQEYRDVFLSSDEESKALKEGTFFLALGVGYALLPALFLWMTRKRYPKGLEPDEDD